MAHRAADQSYIVHTIGSLAKKVEDDAYFAPDSPPKSIVTNINAGFSAPNHHISCYVVGMVPLYFVQRPFAYSLRIYRLVSLTSSKTPWLCWLDYFEGRDDCDKLKDSLRFRLPWQRQSQKSIASALVLSIKLNTKRLPIICIFVWVSVCALFMRWGWVE